MKTISGKFWEPGIKSRSGISSQSEIRLKINGFNSDFVSKFLANLKCGNDKFPARALITRMATHFVSRLITGRSGSNFADTY